jgi:hypothetical protein
MSIMFSEKDREIDVIQMFSIFSAVLLRILEPLHLSIITHHPRTTTNIA